MAHRVLQRDALGELLATCVTDHVITPEQASSIAAHVAPATPLVPRSLISEALGYVGGAVVVVGTILVANLYWDDLSLGARLATLGAAALALAGAGQAVPPRSDPADRLRSVLWLAGVAAVAGFLGVLGSDALNWSEASVALLAGSGATVVAAAFWSRHPHFVQQAATAVALMATSAALASRFTTTEQLVPAAAWLAATAWLVLGATDLLGPRAAVLPVAAAASTLTATSTITAPWGPALALATVFVVVGLAVVKVDLVLLAVGAIGALVTLPAVIGKWFPDSAVMPFVLLAVGLALVGIALWTARRRAADRQ